MKRVGFLLLLILVVGNTSFSKASSNHKTINTNSIQAGNVHISTDKEAQQLLDLSNLEPGSDVLQTITITNDGTVDGQLQVILSDQTETPSSLLLETLRLSVSFGGTELCNKPLSDASVCSLMTLSKTDSRLVAVRIYWPASDALASLQGVSGSVSINWRIVS